MAVAIRVIHPPPSLRATDEVSPLRASGEARSGLRGLITLSVSVILTDERGTGEARLPVQEGWSDRAELGELASVRSLSRRVRVIAPCVDTRRRCTILRAHLQGCILAVRVREHARKADPKASPACEADPRAPQDPSAQRNCPNERERLRI